MKKITTLFAMLICAITMMASPVEPEQARTIALNFMVQKSPTVTRSTECTLAYTWSNDRSSALFYVYNVGGGFVIVSADDAVMPVLGYSTKGTFTGENMPVNCRSWLQGYADEIAYVKENNLSAPEKVSQAWTALAEGREPARSGNSRAVEPLLTTTWDQSPFYNALCPGEGDDQAITGCVATAMAQIINYHQWPAHGYGSHSYYHPTYGQQSADFSSHTYQYDLMPSALTMSSTSAQINAVATLMRDCGVAVNMNYGYYGSGAFSETARAALSNHFNYETSILVRDRRTTGMIIGTYSTTTYYSDDEWKAVLKSELDAANPVFHDGTSMDLSSAHAFVCDGYDANDYFHFNWGWSGWDDGYFAVGNVIPEGADTMFYPSNNIMVLCHPNRSENSLYLFNADGTSTRTVSGTLDISHQLGYNGNYTYMNNYYSCEQGDTLILYPQTTGGQILLEKIAFANNYSNGFRVYVYDGVGIDGTLLMSVTNSTALDPVLSTEGALTLVSSGYGTTANTLLLRATEVSCTPPVFHFDCTDKTFATADLGWEVFHPEEYIDHNFNWRVEYGLHGFTPGTGTTVSSETNSVSIGGLTAETEYDAYLTYTCEGNSTQTVGPLTFKTERVMVCFDEPIVNGTSWNDANLAFGIGYTDTYHWSQQIYTAEELANMGLQAGDEVVALSVQYASNYTATTTCKRSVALYMGNTSKTTFSSNTDWFALENLVNVYTKKENTFKEFHSNEWKKFEFDDPFVWDGHSNVVIAFADSGDFFYTYLYFLCNEGNDNSTLSTSSGEPITLSYSGYLYSDRANMKLCLSTSCPAPSHLTSTALNRHSVQVEWLPGYEETLWNVEYGPAGFERGTGTTRTVHNNPSLIVTQLAAGVYDFYIQADCGSGNTSDWLKLLVPAGGFDCAQIGEGTSTNRIFPLGYYSGNGWYHSYSQQIFTAEELLEQGISGSITSIAFQYGGTPQTKSPVRVLLGNTTQPNMGYDYTWIPASSLQEVFSGSVLLEEGWTTITFDTPFHWDGTSNVVVAILNNSGTDNGTYTAYMHSTSECMALERTSGSPINIATSGDITRYYSRNNMRFCGDGGTCTLHRNLEVSIVEGASYDFYGTPVSEPGTYSHRWWINDECDSLVVLTLTVRKIIFVTTTGSGSHDGTSWANAMQLQEAMDTAIHFTDRIPYLFVKKGTYTGNTSSENSFEIKANALIYGGFVGNEPADYDLSNRTQANMEQTVLFGSNTRRVLYQSADFTETTATLFDGFTIRGGTVNNVGEGGGAYIRKFCTLNNCIITANNASLSGSTNVTCSGVAVYNNGGTITNCEIHNNTINLSGTGSYGVAGVGVYSANGIIENCNIHDNTAVYDGAGEGWSVKGGGVYDQQNNVIFNSSITLNSAAEGGGIYNNGNSSSYETKVSNCIISNNTSRGNGGGVYSYSRYGRTIYTQCLIGNNASGSNGGGVYNYRANCWFVGCDVVRNSAVVNGGGIYSAYGCTMQNSIVWGNKVGATDNQLATGNGNYFTLENSAVQGGYSGAVTLEPENTGEGVGYPSFTNPTSEAGVDVNNAIGDWSLQSSSICIDMGKNIYNATTETDLAGNARIQHERADIGAYESSYGMPFPIHPETELNIIYVTTTGAGAQDGSSWENATGDLQYAMDVAMVCNPPAAVWVAKGTYKPGRPLIVQPTVAVYGGFEGIEPNNFDLSQRDFSENATIIDGDSTHRVLNKSCPFSASQPAIFMTEPGSILMPVTGSKDITACSGTIYDNGGENSSYANNCNGQITLHSYNPNSVFTLTGTYRTESYSDRLSIYDYNDGNMILLGTYYDSGNLSLTSSSSTIVLQFISDGSVNYSGFAINFTASDCTPEIQETVEAAFRTGESLFDGLTFQRGFVSGSSDYAGAYLLDNTDLLNCDFSNNYRHGVYAQSCNINNCLFSNNRGYGLYCDGSSNVSNSTASSNTNCGIYFTSTGTLLNDTMQYNTNSGLYISNGKAEGCLISNNGTSGYGVSSNGSNVRIINSTITNNLGGGLYAYNGLYVNVNIANNSTTNTSYNSAAGVCAQSNARFVNCNIVNNKATSTNINSSNVRGGIYNYSTNNEYTNCIIWGNKTREDAGNLYGEATYSYCAVEGGVDGIANITLDSINNGEEEGIYYVNFVNPSDEAGVTLQDSVDYSLAAGSACINAGNPNTTSLNLPTYDLAGSLRIKQQHIDIGAYEFGDVTIQPINDEVCLGESFFYGNYFVHRETPGLFLDTFIYNQGGMDYIAHISLKVNPVYNINIDTTICEGESCFFNGEYYNTSGTRTAYLSTESGCDSTVVLNLTVSPIQYSEFSAIDCDSYTWNNITYYESGDHVQTLQAQSGCDSIVTLHLTLYHSVETVDSMTLCRSMLPFPYRGVIIGEDTPEHDTILVPLTTVHGCDSTVHMRLTIVDVIATEFSADACDLYVWNNQTYTTSGDKVQSFISAIGCDSIVTLHLTIHHSNAYEFSDAACYQYIWNDVTYTASGNYQQVFTNADGCDSTVILHLTIHTSSEYAFSAEACDLYQWNSSTYTESGIYQQHFTNAAGCDSTVTLTLTVHHSTSTALTATVCETELPYHYVNGQIDTTFEEGTPATQSTFVFNFQTVHGCDSTVTLNLTVVPVAAPQLTVTGQITACESSSATLSVAGNYTSYNWSTGATTPTISVTTPGFYWVSLIDANGCASMTEVTQLGVSTLIPETPAICMVGVENGHNLIVWEELENTNVQNYRIYRENDQANVYELLATVPASQGNAYEDVTADPSVRAWRYKVTAMDVCQGETPMSELHKTVHLTINQGIGNSWNLIWTHYEGFEFQSYRLYRGTANNNLTMIATLPSTLTSYTDYDNVDGALFYQIEVVMNGSCLRDTRDVTYTGSRSNIVYNGEAVYTDTAVLACEEYEWNGIVYNQSGVYQQDYTSALGYEVHALLHLTIVHYPGFSISGNTSIVSGGSTTLSVTPTNPQWTYLWSTGATTSSITVSPTETTTYYVTVSNGPCELSSWETVNVTPTGVNEWRTSDLHIYPNPTTGIVNVELGMEEDWKNAEIQVFDVYGRMLDAANPSDARSASPQTVEIDLSQYATGIYMLKVVNDGKVVAIGKVVKE